MAAPLPSPRNSCSAPTVLGLIECDEEWRNLEVPLKDPGSQTLHYGAPRAQNRISHPLNWG